MSKDAHRLPFTRINGLHAEGTTVKFINVNLFSWLWLITKYVLWIISIETNHTWQIVIDFNVDKSIQSRFCLIDAVCVRSTSSDRIIKKRIKNLRWPRSAFTNKLWTYPKHIYISSKIRLSWLTCEHRNILNLGRDT